VSARLLQRLIAILRHRGPDDEGYAWVDPISGKHQTWGGSSVGDMHFAGILFGHCRLSILDRSSAGHQPFFSDDGMLVLSYNGEIYNFAELRDELQGHGARFHGHSDTEVLLRAYERWGEDALEKLNGMWAFTLWDGRRKKLLASRDRFGVKPLYFTQVQGAWVFASEIKAVLAYPGAHRGVQQANVLEFLVRGVGDHTEDTLFSNVHSVLPGSCVELSAGKINHRRFWKLNEQSDLSSYPESELVKRLHDLLMDSVRIRMRSDVPTGTMLSSGLDSSSIAACVRALRNAGTVPSAGVGSEGFRTFNHAFTACWPGSSLNEEGDVESLANILGLALHKYYPSGEETASLLPKVAYLLDEPFESPIPIIQYVLMGMAKAKGITVVLNGHGCDEMLAGYPTVFAPTFLAGLLLSGRLGPLFKEYRSFRATAELSPAKVLLALARLLAPWWLRRRTADLLQQQAARRTGIFVDAHPSARYEPVALACSQELSPLSSSLWLAFSQRILPQWLRMEDRMSMAQSVESRLPFLDYRLVEFAFRLPDTMKLRDGYTKYALRRAMSDELPTWLTGRRRKVRFAAPYAAWLRGPWRRLIEDLFLGDSFHCQIFLNVPRFRAEMKAYLHDESTTLRPRTVWRIVNTELWLRAFRPPILDLEQ
jgi:asparagine synthase (glutamine-hydrolysing)